ncbi:hypothetical protein [Deinococcus cellulosilyticus]|uniref:Type 4 fimbrial biogenesis protein PilX N-terminal domain-containing protein n=1 Tax=Deinococcus cellulosilyticus (strain DSM 18568 / NBRC 106333 / KACC 11606 / 5516J-15) TaxID=1223518 RepID=A0A511MWG3_DEIC1|nr:hypothetical protein [Deinococcus cellulosilyticus]GEM44466.1 hypothetical protein DC3_01010 [Deinococcus cellulosilyticus NBRC 106333 = KACC 11606]
MDTPKSLRKRQSGAALVMTLGIMLIMVVVLLIASQYTLKGMRTVGDQSTTLEAQYVSESGLAWAKAYVLQLKSRFSSLPPTSKSKDDFINLVSAVCGSGQNVAVTSGCNLPTTEPDATYARNAISTFFKTWEGAPTTDTFWSGVFSDTQHTINLGSGQQYTVYNVYKANGVTSSKPLFSVTRLEWDYADETYQGQTFNLMNNFRFCYDVGYYVSKGTTNKNGSRVVGQFPQAGQASTDSKCPAAASAGAGGSGSGTGDATDPNRNYIEVDVVGVPSTTTTPPITSGIDVDNIAGAVGIEKVSQDSNSVTYEMCGQTSNGNSGACGNNRDYTITYNFAGSSAYSVRCLQNSSGTDITVNLALQNTLYYCQVRSQSNAASHNDYIYFIRDKNNDLVFILGGKTTGNDTVARWQTDGNNLGLIDSGNADHISKMIFIGDCKGVGNASAPTTPGLYFAAAYEQRFVGNGNGNGNSGDSDITTGLTMPSDFCSEASSSNIYDIINQTVPATTRTSIGGYQFQPISTNGDLMFKGRWIQLAHGDL